jgi:hypothetical protein
MTGSGESVFVNERSALLGEAGITVVEAVVVLFAGRGSDSIPETVTVLVIVPAVAGITLTITVVLAPFDRLPRLHVTVAFTLEQPWLGVTETKVTPGGNVSVTVTPVASAGPLLLTLIV